MARRQFTEKELVDLTVGIAAINVRSRFAGPLLALDQGLLHDVEALEQSAFLLTIAWPGEKDRPAS